MLTSAVHSSIHTFIHSSIHPSVRPFLPSFCLIPHLAILTPLTPDGAVGDIPQMWLRDSSVQMSTYVQHAPLLPSFTAVLESILQRQVRFFLGDPYGSAFFQTTGPSPNNGPNQNECAPSDLCPNCTCVECAPSCSAYTYQHDYEVR